MKDLLSALKRHHEVTVFVVKTAENHGVSQLPEMVETHEENMLMGRDLIEIIRILEPQATLTNAYADALAYFGTRAEWEKKRAAARAAYHQRELTKQPG